MSCSQQDRAGDPPASGTVIGRSTVARDITERRPAQPELIEFEKRVQQRERLTDVGAMTTKLIHDLGNPLAAISMQAQLLLCRIEGHPEGFSATC